MKFFIHFWTIESLSVSKQRAVKITNWHPILMEIISNNGAARSKRSYLLQLGCMIILVENCFCYQTRSEINDRCREYKFLLNEIIHYTTHIFNERAAGRPPPLAAWNANRQECGKKQKFKNNYNLIRLPAPEKVVRVPVGVFHGNC